MTHLLFQRRESNRAANSELSKKQLQLKLNDTNLSIHSNSKEMSFERLDYSHASFLINVDTYTQALKDNTKIINRLLAHGCSLSDLTFILPAITGYSDCIIATKRQYIVAPGLTSEYTIFITKEHKITPKQDMQNALIDALFSQSKTHSAWHLIAKSSILCNISGVNVIKRFPRFYSDSSAPTFFDQHVDQLHTNEFVDVNQALNKLFAYYQNTSGHLGLASLVASFDKSNEVKDFYGECKSLGKWLTNTANAHGLDTDELILYLLLSCKKFSCYIVSLYSFSLQGNYCLHKAYRSSVLYDWYSHGVASIIAPFLAPVLFSTLKYNSNLNEIRMGTAEIILSQLLAR